MTNDIKYILVYLLAFGYPLLGSKYTSTLPISLLGVCFSCLHV